MAIVDAADGLLERRAELTRIDTALGEAIAGNGRLIVLEGEAGVGKTSILTVAAARGPRVGVRVLRASGTELEREFDWGVARQLFEPVTRAASSTAHGQPLRGAARQALPVLAATPQKEAAARVAQDAALAIQHGLYWLTANLAEETPVLVIVDDAHWADVHSLQFLHFLARRVDELPALVIAAVRPGEPEAPGQLLGALRNLPGAELLRLGPLSARATAALVGMRLGHPADPAFCDACADMAGGNPFLLGELLRALASAGVAPTAEGAHAVDAIAPPSVAEAVRRRLSAAGPDAVALAQAAAVLGPDASLRHTAAVAGLTSDRASATADALQHADILGEGRPLRFVHPIVRKAVYDDLGEGRRRSLHGASARVLDEAAANADRIAAHLLEAEPDGESWAVEWLLAAGRRAGARGAPERAAAFFSRALAEPPAPWLRPRLQLELGRALRHAGDPEARQALEEALARVDHPGLRIECARELAMTRTTLGDLPGAVSLLEATLASHSPSDREERLMAEGELLVLSAHDEGTALRLSQRIDVLLPGADGRTPGERLVLAAAAHHRLATFRGPAADAADIADRALAGGELLESPYWPGPAIALSWADRDERARTYIEAAAEAARRRGSPLGTTIAAGVRSRFHLMRGELREAEAESAGALTLVPRLGAAMRDVGLGVLVSAITSQGRPEDALEVLKAHGVGRAPLAATWGSHLLLQARARALREVGDLQAAVADAEEAERRTADRGGNLQRLAPQDSAALTFAVAGDHERAVAVAERGLLKAREWGAAGAEGEALFVLGIVEGSVERLAAAVDRVQAAPPRYVRAPALVELGAALRRANRRAEAREPLRQGMDLAHRQGAGNLAERAAEELRACGARPRRLGLTGVDALTPAERRVAQMAARGLSNPEIAQALFVTRKTVVTHLGHVYRKLDITSREELPEALGVT